MMEKRLRQDAGDGAAEEERPWDELGTDLLALVLHHLQTDEVARTAPFVCRSWAAALAGPECWVDVDIEEWCRRCDDERKIDAAVRRLLRKSRGRTQQLSVFKMSAQAFPFVAKFGQCLKVLKIPMSTVTDVMVEKFAMLCKSLTTLDISHCIGITWKGIELFGKHCSSLVYLKRNLPLPEFDSVSGTNRWKIEESEAMAVANTMTGLSYLELCYGCFSDIGLDAILTKCRSLVHLSVLGCWNVKLGGSLEDRCVTIPYFRDPWDSDWDMVYESVAAEQDNDSDG